MVSTNDILVIGGGGKTGRRVIQRLRTRGVTVRGTSRSGDPRFDWEDRGTWLPALGGARAVYITYSPDLAVPGAVDAVGAFARLAVDARRPAPRPALGPRRGGGPARRARVRDAAPNGRSCAAAGSPRTSARPLSRPGRRRRARAARRRRARAVRRRRRHRRRRRGRADRGRPRRALYELTGPRLLTFADATAEIAAAAGRPLRFVGVARDEYASALAAQGVRGRGRAAHLPVRRSARRPQRAPDRRRAAGARPGPARLPGLRARGCRRRDLGVTGGLRWATLWASPCR